MIEAAEHVLEEGRPIDALAQAATHLFERIATLYRPVMDADPPKRLSVWRAQAAGLAAVEAAHDSAGLHRQGFDALNIDPNTPEIEVDSWSGDAAKWADMAVGGGEVESEQDPTARRTFWRWWLSEGLPSAWEVAMHQSAV